MCFASAMPQLTGNINLKVGPIVTHSTVSHKHYNIISITKIVPWLGTIFHRPYAWNDYPTHLPSSRDALILSCFLVLALASVESTADLSGAIQDLYSTT